MMVSAIQALNHNATLQCNRKDSKKSMLSTFDDETAKMFTLLSAEDWGDEDPVLSSFMSKLLQDKSATRARNLVQGRTRRWEGRICKSGILNFLSQGFLSSQIEDRPTGFTIFMHHPTEDTVERAPKERQNQIMAMFGDQEINLETAKHYAEAKFFIATSVDDFSWQLDTCIQSLDLFTKSRGIAAEGYRELRNTIRDKPHYFREMFRADPLFGIKLGALADRVFQDFLDRLLHYIRRRRPIRSAAGKLEFAQVTAIREVFRQVDLGITPPLTLPRSWTPSGFNVKWNHQSTPGRMHELPPPNRPLGSPPPFGGKEPPPGRSGSGPVTNENPKKEWALPPGKSLGDFFNSRDPAQASNLHKWPELYDHRLGKKNSLCIKFHVTGKCRGGCYLSHAPVSTIGTVDLATISARLKKIYSM